MGNTFTNEELDSRALQFKENIVNAAKKEIPLWRKSSNKIIKEKKQDIKILEAYYQATGMKEKGAKKGAECAANNKCAWSAAFICYCAQKAGITKGDGFNFSFRHIVYIVHAIINRENSDESRPFWFYEVEEHEPEVGDIICLNRKRKNGNFTNWSYDKLKSRFITNNENSEEEEQVEAKDKIRGVSHTDIIVAKFSDDDGNIWIRTIGGNVNHTVDMKEFRLDDSGKVDLIRKPSNGTISSNHHVFGYIHIIGSIG